MNLRCLLLGLAFAMGLATAAEPEPSTPATPAEFRRGAEQTFLTFPEWFLVFSPAEYAELVAHGQPDEFPFVTHVGQFWQGYRAVTRASRDRGQDVNLGYHVMVLVIGSSTTVEYLLRAAYEGTMGRLTHRACGCRTPEDDYAARGAQAYVDFIRVSPWYDFDFKGLLAGLWRDVPKGGPHQVRKWERRFALSTEYGIKAVYGALIRWATHATYDAPSLQTVVLASPGAQPLPAGIRQIAVQPDGRRLLALPRYDAFSSHAQALAATGTDFAEVAGNRGAMLVSLLVDTGWQPGDGAQVLFTQPIPTRPGRHRVVALVDVPRLAATLRAWQVDGVRVEHLFDY